MNIEEGRVRQVRRDILVAALIANIVGGTVLIVFLQFLTANSGKLGSHFWVGTSFLAAYGIIVSAVMFGLAPRRFAATLAWIDSGGPPTTDQRRSVLALPARLAAYFFGFWVGAAAAAGAVNGWVEGSGTLRTLQVSVTTLLGGLTSCMALFLIIERRLRPVFAVALADAAPARPATIGIGPRLSLSWALGSGVVLVSLILLPATARQGDHLVGATLFLASIGLLAGAALTRMAARSVADPLESVRAGLRRVQAGDLDVAVTVDDGGEVGLLQAGFNEMTSGLRERLLFRELLDRHIGDEVARYAVEHGVGLSGEMRDVSALFVDVIGSSALAEQRAAPEVVQLLNELFALVMKAVSAEGGWINKFEGDAALCVFGAPGNQADHAARALRAARELGASLMAWAATGGLDAAIGVSSGMAVAGNIGSEERYEYTVIGDPVNEAARLSELAKSRPERLAVSGTTVAAAGTAADGWTVAETTTLRGRTRPTTVFVPA